VVKIQKEPVTAPGDEDILEQDATKKEKKKGNFTRVTELSLDEVDSS
jgi:hypothetical protein